MIVFVEALENPNYIYGATNFQFDTIEDVDTYFNADNPAFIELYGAGNKVTYIWFHKDELNDNKLNSIEVHIKELDDDDPLYASISGVDFHYTTSVLYQRMAEPVNKVGNSLNS